MVNFKPISLNVLCTSKMCSKKIIENFLSFIFSIPESEEITQTAVSHVLRTRCIQRAVKYYVKLCEMLFCIYKNWFWFSKGMVGGWPVCWHRHYLETADQLFFFRCCRAAVAVGILSWLVCPFGLVSIWKAPCELTDSPSAHGNCPFAMGKGLQAWKSCKQSEGANLLLGRKVSLWPCSDPKETILFPLKTKPVSLWNALSLPPNIFDCQTVILPKDVKRNLFGKKGLWNTP